MRTDEQLVALFRDGHDEAFRIIHDRYRQRLFAYTRQMLPGSRQDAEDALQDVFVRAYSGLRANDRDLALRAWLYRVAHNRCIDELRRPAPPAPELIELVRGPVHDPIVEAERRESLRRLIEDVRRLPKQQRSALLMRELGGMSYAELAAALSVSVPAVKSLLVRARVSLAAAAEARETACSEIRDELSLAHDRRVRPNATARRHLRDCAGCREFRAEIRGVSRQFAALVPTLGPLGLVANSLGIGGGAGGGAAAGSGAAVAGTGGTFAASGLLGSGISHVATLLAAAVVTTGGAVGLQSTLGGPARHTTHHHARATSRSVGTGLGDPAKRGLLAAPAPTAPSAPAASVPAEASQAAVSASASPSHASATSGAADATTHRALRSLTRIRNQLAIDNGAASAAASAAGGLDTLPPPDGSTGTDSSSTATPPTGATRTGTTTGSSSTTGSTGAGTGAATGAGTDTGTSSSTTGKASSAVTGPSTATPTGAGGAQIASAGSTASPSSGGSVASGT